MVVWFELWFMSGFCASLDGFKVSKLGLTEAGGWQLVLICHTAAFIISLDST
jgi:hypothetical protein